MQSAKMARKSGNNSANSGMMQNASRNWIYSKRYNQVAGIIYKNIFSINGLDPPKIKWEISQKIVENKVKILWDLVSQSSQPTRYRGNRQE